MLIFVPIFRDSHCDTPTILKIQIFLTKISVIRSQITKITKYCATKIWSYTVIGERLQHLSSQDALLILRNSMAIPKVLYILQTAPCYLSDQLNTFDEALRSILSDVLNGDLSNEQAWLKALLPVRAGGVGVRRAAKLAPSAYLACGAGCSTLVHQILPSSCNSTDPNLDSAISSWNQGLSVPLPTQHANVPGMNPILTRPTLCCWIWFKINKPGLAYWQCHVQSLAHGSMPCPCIAPLRLCSVMTWSGLLLVSVWVSPSAGLIFMPAVVQMLRHWVLMV